MGGDHNTSFSHQLWNLRTAKVKEGWTLVLYPHILSPVFRKLRDGRKNGQKMPVTPKVALIQEPHYCVTFMTSQAKCCLRLQSYGLFDLMLKPIPLGFKLDIQRASPVSCCVIIILSSSPYTDSKFFSTNFFMDVAGFTPHFWMSELSIAISCHSGSLNLPFQLHSLKKQNSNESPLSHFSAQLFCEDWEPPGYQCMEKNLYLIFPGLGQQWK